MREARFKLSWRRASPCTAALRRAALLASGNAIQLSWRNRCPMPCRCTAAPCCTAAARLAAPLRTPVGAQIPPRSRVSDARPITPAAAPLPHAMLHYHHQAGPRSHLDPASSPHALSPPTRRCPVPQPLLAERSSPCTLLTLRATRFRSGDATATQQRRSPALPTPAPASARFRPHPCCTALYAAVLHST